MIAASRFGAADSFSFRFPARSSESIILFDRDEYNDKLGVRASAARDVVDKISNRAFAADRSP